MVCTYVGLDMVFGFTWQHPLLRILGHLHQVVGPWQRGQRVQQIQVNTLLGTWLDNNSWSLVCQAKKFKIWQQTPQCLIFMQDLQREITQFSYFIDNIFILSYYPFQYNNKMNQFYSIWLDELMPEKQSIDIFWP